MKELTTGLFEELSQMIEQSRSKVAQQVNAELTWLYWQVGNLRNLANMARFAEVFPNPEILHALCAKLSWSYFREIIYIEDHLKQSEQIELLELDKSGIHVAEYLRILPDKKLLEEKLNQSIAAAKERFSEKMEYAKP